MPIPTPISLMAQLETAQRLDKFLVSKLAPEHSRAALQQAIERGLVLINGAKATKPHQPVRNGDQIQISFEPEICTKQAAAVDFDIIDVQKDFLIVNKPAGLLVHEAATRKGEHSLVNGLLHRFAEFASLDDASIRPGIVHRIDRDTSGLLLVARTTQAHQELANLFKQRSVHKTYLAVVQGLAPEKGTIDYPIGRHATQPHRMAIFGNHRREALTHFTRLSGNQNASVLAVQLITGRTHQVRVHCAAIGHPLIGDSLYDGDAKLLTRQALHAWKITFAYKDQTYNYTCPIPNDLVALLATLKLAVPQE